MDQMDQFLQRAVIAASGLMESEVEYPELLAFHYAVGLALMGDEVVGMSIPQLTQNGLDALHVVAHEMADNGFDLERYSTNQIADLHMICAFGIAMVEQQ